HTRCYRDWSSDVCSSDLNRATEDLRGSRSLGMPVLGYPCLQLIEEQLAVDRILEASQQLLDDAKRGRRDAARHPRMDTLSQHAHLQLANEVSTQRGRAPQLVVIATLGIETHHEGGFADGIAKRLEM